MKPMIKLILVLSVVLYGISSFHVVNAGDAQSPSKKKDEPLRSDEDPDDEDPDDEDVNEEINKFMKNFIPVNAITENWLIIIQNNLAIECASNEDLTKQLNKPNPDLQKLVGTLIMDINGLLEAKTKLLSDVLENTVGTSKNLGGNILKDLNGIVKSLLQNLSKLLMDLLGGAGGLLGKLGEIIG